MKELLPERLELKMSNIGLAVNRTKTKIMVANRAGKLENFTCSIPGIGSVDHHIYLGSQICCHGCVPEIKISGRIGRSVNKNAIGTSIGIPYLPL